MIRDDDRTEAQRATHKWLVVGTDRFMSGWGKAEGGASFAAWACTEGELRACRDWVDSRGDMRNVREVWADTYRPACKGHLHVYVWQNSRERRGE